MVLLEGVSKVYPGRAQAALAGVDLHVPPGQFTYLTGPSGAGKTTLLRLLFGAELPTGGRVRVGGADLNRLPERKLPLLRRKLGVVFQDFKLLPGESVFENVALPLRVRGARGATVRERVGKVLAQVDLADKARLAAETLSGGEQQRVAIARALVARPPLILADEPTGNLDPQNAREVMRLLVAAHAAGATVIVATHDPPCFGWWPGPACSICGRAAWRTSHEPPGTPGPRLEPDAARSLAPGGGGDESGGGPGHRGGLSKSLPQPGDGPLPPGHRGGPQGGNARGGPGPGRP